MNKEQPPQNNDEADQEAKAQKAAASWTAWQDWKNTCSVAGSSPDSQKILRDEIRWAFWYKFNEILPRNPEKIMSSTKDWAYEFDSAIYLTDVKKYVDGFSEYAKSHPEEAIAHGKFFKDYLWASIPKREYGSELDFIKGKLIGTNGIINQIVAYYIKTRFPEVFHNWKINKNRKTEDAKKQNVSIVSLDQPIGDKSQTLMEVIPSDSGLSPISGPEGDGDTGDNHEIDFEAVLKNFTWQEIACLLASVPGKLTHPTTMDFVGINSIAAMSRFNNDKEFNRKRNTFQKYMEKADTSLEEKKECINSMKKRIKAEKNSEAFLNMIEPDFESIFNRIEAYYEKKYKKEEEDR